MSVFKKRLSLLVLLLLPTLLGLGVWQLSRYQQKLEFEQVYSQRQRLPPLSLNAIKQFDDPLYLPAKVTGYFDTHRYFLLDNQVHKGRAGFALIMPLMTARGDLILVNRGWLSANDRRHIASPETSQHQYQLTGTIYRPLGKTFLLKEDKWSEGWPKVIQELDFAKASRALGGDIPAYLLNLNKDQPGSLDIQRKRPVMSSDKHLGYALQWFTMAAVLLGLYLFHMRVKE